MRRTRAGTVGPLCLAVTLAAAALAGCGTQRAGTTGADDPPVLFVGTGALAAGAAGGGVPDLDAELPDGPDAAAVHRFTGEVTAREVAALAAALGLTGSPQQHAYGWSVGGPGDAELTVRSDGTGAWAYASSADRCAPRVDVDAPDGPDAVTSCAQAPDLLDPAPGEQAARAAAAPVLAAVGLGDAAETRVEEYGATTWVSLDPAVAGLPTTGVGTTVAVTAEGIAAASGHLRATEPGDSYPLVSARAAWTRFGELPVPEIGVVCPAPGPESAPPCSTTPPPITRVELGLVPRTDPDGALLVPAWLFISRAGTSALVAVEPRLLGDPGTGSGDGTGDGSTGQVEPGAPGVDMPRSHGPVVNEPSPEGEGVEPAAPGNG